MTLQQLKELFWNNTDCYAAKDYDEKMTAAMTEDTFIRIIRKNFPIEDDDDN